MIKNENLKQEKYFIKMSTFYEQIQQLTIEGERKIQEPTFNVIKQSIESCAKSGKQICYVRGDDKYFSLLKKIRELENFNIKKLGTNLDISIEWKNENMSFEELERNNEDLRLQIELLKDELDKIKHKIGGQK